MQQLAVIFTVCTLLIGASCAPSAGQPEQARRDAESGLAPLGAEAESLPPLPTRETREEALDHLREGRELRRQGDVAGADARFDRAIQLVPHFRDWTHVVAAIAAAEAGDSADVRRRIDAVRGGAAAEWAWRVGVDALQEMGDLRGALARAETAIDRLESVPARAAARARVGALRYEMGDSQAALEAYREAMREDRSTPGALAAGRAMVELDGIGPDDRLLAGRTLLAHGGVPRGVAAIEAFLDSRTGSAAEQVEARMEAGRALFRARDWPGTYRLLTPLARTSPEAALLAARSDYRQGRTTEGRAALLAIPRTFPGTDQAAEALFLVADLDHDAGRISSARELYRQAVATGAGHISATDAAVRLAGLAILAGDPRTAHQELERFFETRPRNARTAPAVYWIGRAHLLEGETDLARASFEETLRLDPFSYYGGRAAERLGGSIGEIPVAAPPEVSEGTEDDVDLALMRMDLLRALEMEPEAAFEMSLLRARSTGASEALYRVAEGMIERGQPIAGALLGREIHRERGAWDERLLRIVFQYPFRDLIEREAARHGLDPFMIAGLIRQESLFNPVAVSPVGAMGLMQVMPATARGLAGRAGVGSFRTSMLTDPDVNVRLGTLFLADQMRRWGGDRNDVFAAYNAGPNRVVRWRTYDERADEDVYVERIPIAETRDYVKKVRFHTHVYRRLYGAD
jgi:soluble lytic murein transglycosylase